MAKKTFRSYLADLDSLSRLATGRPLSDNISRLTELLKQAPGEPINTEDEDDCALLGIAPGASEKVIRMAYKGYCWDNHPDRVQGKEAKEAAEARFKQGQQAYKRVMERRQWKP